MSDAIRILIADDNADLLTRCLSSLLREEGDLKVDSASTPKLCLAKVMTSYYDVVVLDISFTAGGLEGLNLIKDVRALSPETDIIMMSSIDDGSVMLKAMECGANNYVVKGLTQNIDEITLGIKSALAQKRFKKRAAAEGQLLAASIGAVFGSSKMRHAFSLASTARRATNQNVLITGPTGVGKDVIATAVAREADGIPFVIVNCGAIARSLIESELFGYVHGSFTGAKKDKAGLFEEADGGDIFLDEVATLPARAQVALLRVLQSGEFNRVGSTDTVKVNIRVIAATNEDLEQAVAEGKFREDLLARLKGISIAIPPLCERREDIWPIVEQTIKKSDKPQLKLTPDCLAFLEAYTWPQNVRQLKAAMNSMIAFASSDVLSIGDLPKEILAGLSSPGIQIQKKKKIAGEATFQIPRDLSFDNAVQLFQTKFINLKLEELRGRRNISALAEHLAIPRQTLTRKLQELGISVENKAN
jgi:two-component system NtrC family response regulator